MTDITVNTHNTTTWKQIISAYLGLSALLLTLHSAFYSFHPPCHPYLVADNSTVNTIIATRAGGGEAVCVKRRGDTEAIREPLRGSPTTTRGGRATSELSSCPQEPEAKPG